MKLSTRVTALLILLIIFGGIVFSNTAGWWQTETRKLPATFNDGQLAGQYNPADIRGSYTFGDVSALFGIPLETLRLAFRLPDENPGEISLKDLESLNVGLEAEVGTASVRMFTALYRGLPFDQPGEEVWLFPEGAQVLVELGTLDPFWLNYITTHTIGALPQPKVTKAGQTPTPTVSAEPALPFNSPTPAEHLSEPGKVSAKTTFQEVYDWGISEDALQKLLNQTAPDPKMIIKDWVNANGLLFSELKASIENLYDTLP